MTDTPGMASAKIYLLGSSHDRLELSSRNNCVFMLFLLFLRRRCSNSRIAWILGGERGYKCLEGFGDSGGLESIIFLSAKAADIIDLIFFSDGEPPSF